MSLENALWREEITVWEDNTPNHIYITRGTDLIGYVPRGTTVPHVFNTPKKSWSVTRRKFRKLSKKEIKTYLTITE